MKSILMRVTHKTWHCLCDTSKLLVIIFCNPRFDAPFPPRCLAQLRNKGEQGDKTYAEMVPWLETAFFGGFLAGIEVTRCFQL